LARLIFTIFRWLPHARRRHQPLSYCLTGSPSGTHLKLDCAPQSGTLTERRERCPFEAVRLQVRMMRCAVAAYQFRGTRPRVRAAPPRRRRDAQHSAPHIGHDRTNPMQLKGPADRRAELTTSSAAISLILTGMLAMPGTSVRRPCGTGPFCKASWTGVSRPTATLMNGVHRRWRRLERTCRRVSASRGPRTTRRVVRGQLANQGVANTVSWPEGPIKSALHRSWLSVCKLVTNRSIL